MENWFENVKLTAAHLSIKLLYVSDKFTDIFHDKLLYLVVKTMGNQFSLLFIDISVIMYKNSIYDALYIILWVIIVVQV